VDLSTRAFCRPARGRWWCRTRTGVLVVTLGALLLSTAQAQERFITVASTTSTENSGLFRHILPLFRQKTGIQARVIAQGTGQALDTGKRGDADVVFVHDKAKELALVKDGWFVDRREVMYNDFVLVGPKSDPAKVAGGKDIVAALERIHATQAPFASRGDRSGTHAAELRLWKAAALEMPGAKGPWYRETGSGMGATLNTASGMDAYVLADRGTWLSFKNRGELTIVVQGDRRLFNQYGVMLVNPAKHPHVRKADAVVFIDWVTSPEGQQAIADFKLDGEQLFFPNYQK